MKYIDTLRMTLVVGSFQVIFCSSSEFICCPEFKNSRFIYRGFFEMAQKVIEGDFATWKHMHEILRWLTFKISITWNNSEIIHNCVLFFRFIKSQNRNWFRLLQTRLSLQDSIIGRKKFPLNNRTMKIPVFYPNNDLKSA